MCDCAREVGISINKISNNKISNKKTRHQSTKSLKKKFYWHYVNKLVHKLPYAKDMVSYAEWIKTDNCYYIDYSNCYYFL